ncbi:MAG: leucine-rich repeat domain-containing protein [Bacteroidetes bacterium]|nr:leucine-rich repeat domain-containing protein [Bacteroidota bacterium]
MIKTKCILFLAFYFFFAELSNAQSIKGYSQEQLTELSTKVEDQVRFLEFLLNTVGDPQTSARDKDVIIRESYLKIFRDSKVQIEDDLLQDRKVVTNKDVTAYFKDIEFFFKSVEFKFKIREIKPFQKDNGDVFFLASLDRSITAVGLKGDKVASTKSRFIEINLDEKTQELKIASIYTTKVSRDVELTAWWNTLDTGWKSYFKQRFQLSSTDSVDLALLYKFVSVDSITFSGNRQIRQLAPLSELRDLTYLDISHTSISNLAPISNITLLESLILTNTPTSEIQFIKYSERLRYLDISRTKIENISDLLHLTQLTSLKASQTPIQSFAVLNQFKNLQELDLSESGFNNVENIKSLTQLQRLNLSKNYMLNYSFLAQLPSLIVLDLSGTNINDLAPLSSISQLEYVDLTGSQIGDLTPLENLPRLRKIAADQTNLTDVGATNFIRSNPEVLLIHHVKDLEAWWQGLSLAWKEALIRINPQLKREQPGVELLTQTLGSTSLNLDNTGIESLNPLVRFVNLTTLSFSDNPLVTDLLPLSENSNLRELIAKNTGLLSLGPLQNKMELTKIDVEGSEVKDFDAMLGLSKLTYLNVNATRISQEEVPDFLLKRPEVSFIYRSSELAQWWDALDEDWKNEFRSSFNLPENPSIELLHHLTAKSTLNFKNLKPSSLDALTIFSNLRNLSIFDAPVFSIEPVSQLKRLTSLTLSQIPAIDYFSLRELLLVTELNLSNTGIEDLEAISFMINIKKLNLSGTNIKSLKGLEALTDLEELDVASTEIRSLKALEGLRSLKKLSCFNTRLSIRSVDSFKASFPNCEVRYY